MPAKLQSISDLEDIRARYQKENENVGTVIREKVLICMGGGCLASGSQKIKDCFESTLQSAGLHKSVKVIGTGCMGPCSNGPVVIMANDKTFYQNVTVADVKDIVEQHIKNHKVVDRLLYREDADSQPIPVMTDIGFFKRQTKVVLRNCGLIDPMSIEDYIGRDGYFALAKALTSMSRDNVLNEVEKSGLRGRGGAGFHTSRKWKLAANISSDKKYVLCNADEGDPGAYMDRSVLEGDPHTVIEGMAIGAFTIGASEGFVYVRAEYPLAVERLQIALDKAREYGLLGENILGTGFSFNLEIRMGSGAFVCGEETALIASIEGKRGEPRPRPPFRLKKDCGVSQPC